MALKEKDVKRYSAILLVVALAILSFIIIRPILLSIIAGLVLAYVFRPVYKIVFSFFKEKTTSALAVCVLVVLILFVPIWFLLPIVLRQLFDAFNYIQAWDVASFVREILPTSSTQLQIDITTTLTTFIGKVTTNSLTNLTAILVDLPTVLLHLAVLVFVFFFAMRDADLLKAFVSDLSPLKKERGTLLAKQFKQITNSIIYGNFIIGIVQGVATGIGLLMFGVPRALLLTLLAILASVLPVVGPWIIWIPAAIFLFTEGSTAAAIGFAIYSVIIVSTVDNILRPYIISRRTKSSSAVVLIGMIGGLMTFGILGLLLGPLILEYLILFLDAYRNKTLSDMFEE